MKKYWLIVLLSVATSGFAQKVDTTLPQQKLMDSLSNANKQTDSPVVRDIPQNTDELVRIVNENKRRQKRAAIIRISIGVVLLVILILGLMRRKRSGAPVGQRKVGG